MFDHLWECTFVPLKNLVLLTAMENLFQEWQINAACIEVQLGEGLSRTQFQGYFY
jgi:hypothetical protein